MNAALKLPPRYFVGPLMNPNGYGMFPIYDRRRLVERREPLYVVAWCEDKLDAECVAAALNLAHAEAK